MSSQVPENIGIVKPSALGDIIQSLPILGGLRSLFPQSRISWIVRDSYSEILEGHPLLDKVIAYPRAVFRPWAGRRQRAELAKQLRSQNFDLTIDLQGLLRSGIISRWTAAPRRLGLSDCREGAHWFYTDLIPAGDRFQSAVDKYWTTIKHLGGSGGPEFELFIPPQDHAWADRQLAALPNPRIAINPGATWETKRWPARHFGEIIARLTQQGLGVVLVGSNDDQAAASEIEQRCGTSFLNLAGKTSLKQLAALLSRVSLVITNDSGPMHLAAALGTKCVAVFTCTSPLRARPYGAGHLVVHSHLWCHASYLKRCGRMECMSEITPDRVWRATKTALDLDLDRAAA